MVRKPRSAAAMEPRGSITDPRVSFVPVPNARRLVRVPSSGWHSLTDTAGALVWLEPGARSDEELQRGVANLLANGAAAVRVLPREAEDAALPAEAGSPAPTSDVSDVRPVVSELVAELPEALRSDVAEACDRHLSDAGL